MLPSDPGVIPLALSQDKLDEFLESPFAFVIGVTRDDVARHFGPPDKELRRSERNRHDPRFRDVYHELHYDGLRITVASFPAIPRVDLTSVSLTDGRYTLKYGIKVGALRRKVEAVLGKPSVVGSASTWTYSDSSGYITLTFSFRGDRVAKIKWEVEAD